jgi:hypothetical protein
MARLPQRTEEGHRMAKADLIPAERIEKAILLIRGQKVLLDRDLAELYGVPTKRLNEQVRRNLRRFPDDFMFQLTAEEAGPLRSQFATLKAGRGQHSKYLPYAFTEHDEKFAIVFEAIRQLMAPPPAPTKPRIGFHQD